MTSSPGLRGRSRLQSNYRLPWSVADDDKRRRETTTRRRQTMTDSKTILASTLCVGGSVKSTKKYESYSENKMARFMAHGVYRFRYIVGNETDGNTAKSFVVQ